MRDSGPIVHKPQWSILHALMPSFPQSYYWINAKTTHGYFCQKLTILANNWKRRKIGEHLLSRCSFPVYSALLPILCNLSFFIFIFSQYFIIYLTPYLNCRARPYYHGAALCFTLPACLATDSEEFAFTDFFLQSLASGQGLDHLNWIQVH